ncbi:Juvenile hormone-binding protein [Eumeta japonica]|uniref:Juvenile hormone-binding protein n=1 Tax=Eumeta variegata TaxID=151549 RepID=A0A4C1VZ54_EUMVA|nr:Juvenile hormone-binding protein [Eumeta japonica]
MVSVLYFVSAIILVYIFSAAPAIGIIPCKINDFDCQTKSAKEYVATFAQGIPALELPALDPLFLDKLEDNIKGLKMNFKNLNITGMEHTEIEDIQ